ncbi:hypothetical protein GE21DRAFT_1275895 [Neurospora crassa]|nr:hypothetical protein GE21DRAFT_1275895 [Neurospora crassa]
MTEARQKQNKKEWKLRGQCSDDASHLGVPTGRTGSDDSRGLKVQMIQADNVPRGSQALSQAPCLLTRPVSTANYKRGRNQERKNDWDVEVRSGYMHFAISSMILVVSYRAVTRCSTKGETLRPYKQRWIPYPMAVVYLPRAAVKPQLQRHINYISRYICIPISFNFTESRANRSL